MLHQGFSEDDDAFRDVALELHRELKLQPWHPFVVDVGSIGDPDEECSPPDDPSHLRDWLMVREIRRRLVAARRSDVRFRGVVSSGRRNTLSQTQEMEWIAMGRRNVRGFNAVAKEEESWNRWRRAFAVQPSDSATQRTVARDFGLRNPSRTI